MIIREAKLGEGKWRREALYSLALMIEQRSLAKNNGGMAGDEDGWRGLYVEIVGRHGQETERVLGVGGTDLGVRMLAGEDI